jgi:hypothetical protein
MYVSIKLYYSIYTSFSSTDVAFWSALLLLLFIGGKKEKRREEWEMKNPLSNQPESRAGLLIFVSIIPGCTVAGRSDA